VTSWGFLEWEESVGAGKPIHIAPGNRFTLDVQLEPSNPLSQRIPGADSKKYQGISDVKDWRNPYLIVRVDGIEVVGVTDGRSSLTVDAVTAILEGLPDSAWPYGWSSQFRAMAPRYRNPNDRALRRIEICSSGASMSLE